MGENAQSKFDLELEKIGITLNEQQKQQFDKYYEMLVEWNKVMNLTGITEYEEVNLKHFTDSLTIARTQEMQKVQSVIDIGTGAGFPGIPLKIAFPHLKVVLLDSLNKRIKFLDAVIEELGLENISTIHGRAEDLARDKSLRAAFDLCVSRAVANLSVLSEYCIPFVRTNGYFVSYKGKKGLEEISNAQNCMNVLGCKIEKVDDFRLEEDEAERLLIRIKKCKGTPKLYPRKAGTPSKNPL